MSNHRVNPKAGWVDPKTLPKGPTGRRLCRCGCGREVGKGRRTFYGDECVHEWRIRTDPGYVREQVFKRDRGVCAVCGVDTGAEATRINRLPWDDRYEARQQWGVGFEARCLWEADHIVPVVEGGGECGLDGYRTLCLKCHRKATAELARRRAEARKSAVQAALL